MKRDCRLCNVLSRSPIVASRSLFSRAFNHFAIPGTYACRRNSFALRKVRAVKPCMCCGEGFRSVDPPLRSKSDVLDVFCIIWIHNEAIQQRSDSRLFVALVIDLPGHENGMVKVWGGDSGEAFTGYGQLKQGLATEFGEYKVEELRGHGMERWHIRSHIVCRG
jgi:hypothetical protein